MMHKVWSSIEEVPYCFSTSSVKFQGHIALKIVEFDSNWAFPDSNSSLNSPMAMKCCTKLETAKKRCPIAFQGHPSNFKVTRDKTSPILTQIGRFRTIGRSQLSNPSDLPCLISACCSVAMATNGITLLISDMGMEMLLTCSPCISSASWPPLLPTWHYNDVIMSAMASQTASLAIVYSTVYSRTDERKHQSSTSLTFVMGIHRWLVNSPHQGPVTWKMFPFDDVIVMYRRLGHGSVFCGM